MAITVRHAFIPTKAEVTDAVFDRSHATLRALIWCYFLLLIFEGALRKWVVPSLASPLLLVRDPFVIAILASALWCGALRKTAAFYATCALALAMVIAGLLVLPEPAVILYGLRCDFLHLALIFVLPSVLTEKDLKALGNALLLLSIPLALLMVVQFRSPAHSWINSGIDDTFSQIGAVDHVRAPATFSFISGPAAYFALACAVLVGAYYDSWKLSRLFMVVTAASILIAGLVSGSRNLIASLAVVLGASLLAATTLKRGNVLKTAGALVVLAGVGAVVAQTSLAQDGGDVLSSRFSGNGGDSGLEGFVSRYFGDFAKAADTASYTPPLGFGFGSGTSAASAFLSASGEAHMVEVDWSRIVYESGPILGTLYICFRVILCGWLFWRSINALRLGSMLPLCIFISAVLLLLNGQMGQPTTLGFAALGGGLCLTAVRVAEVKARVPLPVPTRASS